MTPLLINLPDWARERLRQIAQQEGIGMNELIEKWIVERAQDAVMDPWLARMLNAADGLLHSISSADVPADKWPIIMALSAVTYEHGKQGPIDARNLLRDAPP